MTKVYNITKHLKTRRLLRRKQPYTERLLWSKLRNRQLLGLKFRRQYGIGNFVVDFCCPETKLVIELDGDSHYVGRHILPEDRKRQKYIENLGFTVLRFTNKDIQENSEGVLEKIMRSYKNLT
ncbi:MAG: hypothetical protein COT92_00885 [Candidatus Doudnabacteria bacterium CG10_big_fil_rev_8_21_14_0_10_42_18]|uniref:DUF559 domain-containing protein n=1 Tax=Candidatus Doudnabacteria bacterium CG10_big_fil_rev_8_21_14_0_10_42_18 TaxID=1974552 RepID=A0A2H0VDQ1_9BACT|nr:MAG: hypothetical protein COT92_00885 [Candidatus Doudnabacteria bacterium CG10_big_fil_rev_8_21_14_0_10_42_18]